MIHTGTEILDNGTRVFTAPGAAFGTDALLLARFAVPKKSDTALELCSGCGIVSLMWHDMGYRGPCTALEIDAGTSALCAAAAAENGAEHITALCADLRTFCLDGQSRGRYSFAACNPPYFESAGGPASPNDRRAAARHDGLCTLADVSACASRALHDGGRFVMVHRPERMAEIFCRLSADHLEPKRAAMVKNKNGGAPWLFLVEAQKNRRPGLRWEPDILIENGAALYGPARGQGLSQNGEV